MLNHFIFKYLTKLKFFELMLFQYICNPLQCLSSFKDDSIYRCIFTFGELVMNMKKFLIVMALFGFCFTNVYAGECDSAEDGAAIGAVVGGAAGGVTGAIVGSTTAITVSSAAGSVACGPLAPLCFIALGVGAGIVVGGLSDAAICEEQ
jgi:hypothetical protein